MEGGFLFIGQAKSSGNPQTYEEGMLLPIMSSDQLVSSRRYRFILDKLSELSLLPPDHFANLYETLIANFAEFVQLIPPKPNGVLGGLLNSGLVRGMVALDAYTEQYGSKSTDALNRYAVFSAALLLDVSKAVTNQRVMITNSEGKYVTEWRPFVGPMCNLGTYYKFYPISAAYKRLDNSITAILARQIMPESGFLWLSSHWRIFADWLEALAGGRRGAGRITHIISRVLEEDLLELLAKIANFNIDPFDAAEFGYGDDFLKWLKEGLEDGSIDVNAKDGMVHVVEEGVYVDRQMFKQYADIINLPVSINVVFAQFGNLTGIVNIAGDYGFQFKQYFSDDAINTSKFQSFGRLGAHAHTVKNGMLVKDPGLIFTGKTMPTTSTYIRAAQDVPADLPQITNKKSSPGQSRGK